MARARRKATMAYHNRRDDEEANDSKERHHRAVRDDGIEIRRIARCANHKGSRYR